MVVLQPCTRTSAPFVAASPARGPASGRRQQQHAQRQLQQQPERCARRQATRLRAQAQAQQQEPVDKAAGARASQMLQQPAHAAMCRANGPPTGAAAAAAAAAARRHSCRRIARLLTAFCHVSHSPPGRATYRPSSYSELVSDAVASIATAMGDGLTRMEVEFPAVSNVDGACCV